VVVDPRWAARVRYTEIRAEALGAFHAATRELGNPDPNSIPEPASIARLRELSHELLGTSTAEHSRRLESPHETKEHI
jgi:hypothetical protein